MMHRIARIIRFMVLVSLFFATPLSAEDYNNPRAYLIRYCQLINQHAYRQAARLGTVALGPIVKGVGQEAARLRRRFANVKSLHIIVGKSTSDGAAGSDFETMPVRITLEMKSGRIRKTKGIITLRGQSPLLWDKTGPTVWWWWDDTTKVFLDESSN